MMLIVRMYLTSYKHDNKFYRTKCYEVQNKTSLKTITEQLKSRSTTLNFVVLEIFRIIQGSCFNKFVILYNHSKSGGEIITVIYFESGTNHQIKRRNLFLNSNQRLKAAERKQKYIAMPRIKKGAVLKLEMIYHSNRLCKQEKAALCFSFKKNCLNDFTIGCLLNANIMA